MATKKESRKLTADEKAEKSSIAWAEKGDPYSCLDFRILLLKNPKVKPPGYTDRDIAGYFGKVSLLSAYDLDSTDTYKRNIWGKSKSRRRGSKSSKYGSLTSTLSTWVGKKPSSTSRVDVDKIINSLKPETIEMEEDDEDETTKLTTVRRDWRNFGKKVKSEIKTKIRNKEKEKKKKNENCEDGNNNDGGKTARSSPRPSTMKNKNKNGITKKRFDTGKKPAMGDDNVNKIVTKKARAARKSPRVKAPAAIKSPRLTAPAKELADEKMKEYKEEIIRPAIATPKMSHDEVGANLKNKKKTIKPHPPPISSNDMKNSSKNPSSTFGNRKPRSKLKMKLLKKDISNNKKKLNGNNGNTSDDNEEEKTTNSKKEYGPSSWRKKSGFVPPRMRLSSKGIDENKDSEDNFETKEVKKRETYSASSWRKDIKKTTTKLKKNSDSTYPDNDDDSFFNDDDDDEDDELFQHGTNVNIDGIEFGLLSAKKTKKRKLFSSTPDSIQTKTMANLNKAGGKTAAIKSKIKVAMRVLIPIFNESKNRFDETSTLQALETLQKIAEEPKGSLILSNMKMIEKLKIIITSTTLSSNIQGVGFNILATMISTLAKLGNSASALNGSMLIDLVKSSFSYVNKIFEENLLFNDGNGTSVGKTYEETSKMEGVVSSVTFIKSIVEFIRRVRPNLQEHFVYSGGLHILLILSYCNIRKASRVARVVLQRFELRELMHLSSPALELDLPVEVMNSTILEQYEEALKTETMKRVERTRREHAVVRKQIEDSNADTPRTEDAGIRRERLNKWLQKRDAEAAKEREKFSKRKMEQLKIQKEIEKIEAEKLKAEAATRAAVAEKQRMLLFARQKKQKNVSEEQKRRKQLEIEEETRRRANLSASNRKAWLDKKKKEQIRKEMEEKIRLESIEIAKKIAALRKQKHDQDMAKNQYTEYNR